MLVMYAYVTLHSLLWYRRLLNDDARGVGEALNEKVCVLENCEGLTVILLSKQYIQMQNHGKYFNLNPLGSSVVFLAFSVSTLPKFPQW